MTYRIAIIGTREAVAGFSLLGVDVVPVTSPVEAIEQLFRLKRAQHEERGVSRNTYGIVFIIEDLLSSLSPDDERKLGRGALPAIIPLPSSQGSTGYGLERLTRIVERAIGSNILA
jgi:V/A-type H+-transporting ATPase subunit F